MMYTDIAYGVAHVHIWKSATQVSAYVTDRMAQKFKWQ